MPTQDDRIGALERKVAMLELLRTQDEKKAQERIPPVQAQNLREINEQMTILLGVASGQESDIRTIKEDVGNIKEDVASIKERLGGLEERFDGLQKSSNEHTTLLSEHTALLTQILARLPEKP